MKSGLERIDKVEIDLLGLGSDGLVELGGPAITPTNVLRAIVVSSITMGGGVPTSYKINGLSVDRDAFYSSFGIDNADRALREMYDKLTNRTHP
jgi:hypothetical protein